MKYTGPSRGQPRRPPPVCPPHQRTRSYSPQAYISRARVESFSLTADLMYVSQNAPRIARALFEICLRRGWSSAAELCLTLSKAFELRLWPEQHPLRQFEQALPFELLRKLEDRQLGLDQLAVSLQRGRVGWVVWVRVCLFSRLVLRTLGNPRQTRTPLFSLLQPKPPTGAAACLRRTWSHVRLAACCATPPPATRLPTRCTASPTSRQGQHGILTHLLLHSPPTPAHMASLLRHGPSLLCGPAPRPTLPPPSAPIQPYVSCSCS